MNISSGTRAKGSCRLRTTWLKTSSALAPREPNHAVARAAGRLRTIDPSPSLHQPYTLWEGLIAGTFLALDYFGCDQRQVQPYLSGRSLREMRMSLLFNAAFKIPMQALILFTGAMVFVFYHFHAIPLLWNPGDLRRLQAETPAAARQQLQQAWEAALGSRRAER